MLTLPNGNQFGIRAAERNVGVTNVNPTAAGNGIGSDTKCKLVVELSMQMMRGGILIGMWTYALAEIRLQIILGMGD